MRPIFINILILFLITACGTLAPQVTVTLPPTITSTITPSFTSTVAFTPTPDTAVNQANGEPGVAPEPIILPEDQLFNKRFETPTLAMEIAPGMTLGTRIVTDESGGNSVYRISVNEKFVNSNSEPAVVAIPKFSFALLHNVGTHTGGAEGTGFDVDLATYGEMLAEANAGTRGWSEVGIMLKQIWVPGADAPTDIIIVPGAEQASLPAGMRAINEVVYVIGGEFDGVENMTSTNKGNGTGKAVLNGVVLYLYTGLDDDIDKDVRGQSDVRAEGMSQMAEFLRIGDGTPSANYDLAKILKYNKGKSAIQIFDANGNLGYTEAITNP